jgi:hypothetical protein
MTAVDDFIAWARNDRDRADNDELDRIAEMLT